MSEINEKFLNCNGIITKNKAISKFYIFEYEDVKGNMNYIYEGDSIFYEMDSNLVLIYDIFLANIFPDFDEYYSKIYDDPIILLTGGLDSDINIGKRDFEEFLNENNGNSKIYKKLYLADCQFLIATLQDLVLQSNSNFIQFYKELCETQIDINIKYDYGYCISNQSRKIITKAKDLFIALYSCFDLLTKICYEFEHLKKCDTNYPKLSSCDKLYNPKCIKKLDFLGTIFEKSKYVTLLQGIRNDLVHNCGFEFSSKLYYKLDECNVIEKYMFFPDFNEEGIIDKIKNRNRFFSKEIKLNKFLPEFYFDIVRRINVTIEKIIKIYKN